MSTFSESQMLDTVRGTAIGQQMIEEISQRELTERRSAKRRIEELRGELAHGLPALTKREDAAQARVDAAKKALDEAAKARTAAYAAREAFAAQRQHVITRLEIQLRDTAPALIDEAIREIDRSADKLRRDGLSYATVEAVVASIETHAEARQAAESLRYEAVDDFAEALAKIRASIELPGAKS